jgi:hypothetical protein
MKCPKATKGQILITAQKSAFFDANLGYGLYTGDVKARHPQMYIECEELEIYMAKQEGVAAPKPKPANPAAKDSDILAPAQKRGRTPPPPSKKPTPAVRWSPSKKSPKRANCRWVIANT